MIGMKIKCKLCGDEIQSPWGDKLVWCKCKACAVDGGNILTRLIGITGTYEIVNLIVGGKDIVEDKDADNRT